jgi:hypothetical protein
MTHTLQFRLAAVLLLLLFAHSTLFGQVFRNAPRRAERPAGSGRQAAPATPSPSNAKSQLQRLSDEIKANPRKISENDLNRCQKLLLDAVNDLQRRLPREFDRTTANDWSTTFQLAELKTTLGKKTPDTEILGAVQNTLLSDKEGVRWVVFDGLRTALRRYQTIAQVLEENVYESRLIRICENLAHYIDEYSEGRNPLYFVTLSEATAWLDDIAIVEPRAARLAEVTRAAFSGVNVRLQIGSGLATAGFAQDIEEEIDVNETILGTKVVGEGMLTGKSSAELVSSPKRAAINVLANAAIETNTDGSQKMVTLKNHTTGTLRGEKQIIFTAEGISTTPARARAHLNAQISDVRINAGPIIKMVARSQIDSRKEDSQAEAARRAERRMSTQMNDRIDPNITELNAKYQKIREALIKPGLFPRVWNLSSTPQQIDWAILLGNKYQPSAPVPAPALQSTNGLAVQVHQSALNNMLAIALAGRSIDEERFSKRMEEFFDETPEFLKRKSGETPAKVSFGPRAPVDVLFMDNKIRVVVRINDIQVMDNVGRAFTISVEYRIKAEGGKVILEQTEAEAFPVGFTPGGGATLSAAQTIIRSYLLRRLDALQKCYELESWELGGEWSGKGRLVPKSVSTEGGWLTFVGRWE